MAFTELVNFRKNFGKIKLGWVSFFTLFFCLWTLAHSQELLGKCNVNQVPQGTEVNVVYMGNNSLPYSAGASARAGPINLIVYHYPYGSCDLRSSVGYGHTFDSGRGGFFGYHFYVAQDGTIAQGAPMFKRTNHVNPANSRGVLQYNNNTSIGITLVCGERGTTKAQVDAAVKIGQALQVAYNVPNSRVVGHGEIQTNRGVNEGSPAQQTARASTPRPPYVLNYTAGSRSVRCVVDGPVPAGCSANNCGFGVPPQTISNPPLFNNNLHDPLRPNPQALQDLPLLQRYFPEFLPKEFRPDQQTPENLPKNPKIYEPNKDWPEEGRLETPLPKMLKKLVDDNLQNLPKECPAEVLEQHKEALLKYYKYYQLRFFEKYGPWTSIHLRRDLSLNLETVKARWYAKKIRSKLNEVIACVTK